MIGCVVVICHPSTKVLDKSDTLKKQFLDTIMRAKFSYEARENTH